MRSFFNTNIKRLFILLCFAYLVVGTLCFYFWSDFSNLFSSRTQKPLFHGAIVQFPSSPPLFVLVAKTPHQQSYGLMFQKDLPPYHGMLFIFSTRNTQSNEQKKHTSINTQKQNPLRENKKNKHKKNTSQKDLNNQNHDAKYIHMWMKNTFIPLDMIFLDKKNCIISVKRHLRPFDTHWITAPEKTKKIIELQIDKSKKIHFKNHPCALIYKKK